MEKKDRQGRQRLSLPDDTMGIMHRGFYTVMGVDE